MMTPVRVVAIVYVGAGRRYFSKRSAYNAIARKAVSGKHPCACEDASDDGAYPGYVCGAHGEMVDKVVKRLARWLRWRDGVAKKAWKV